MKRASLRFGSRSRKAVTKSCRSASPTSCCAWNKSCARRRSKEVDPGVCREHLQKLLTEEFNALTQLETVLDREHELLVANDVDGLDSASDSRQACVAELLRIEDERRSLCRMMNVPTDAQGLERLLRWCDP